MIHICFPNFFNITFKKRAQLFTLEIQCRFNLFYLFYYFTIVKIREREREIIY